MAYRYFYDRHPDSDELRKEIIRGLGSTPKVLPPKLFYDVEGSRLFDLICDLPEYYLTRAEVDILNRYKREIASQLGKKKICLMELGTGNGLKGRLMIEALRPAQYVAIDIALEQLRFSAQELADHYSWLDIYTLCADYCQPLWIDFGPIATNRLVFFPGSTIGNFEHEEVISFLKGLRGIVGTRGGMLIGIDLKKDAKRIEAAYNDKAGVTAAFNLNVLNRLRRELQAEIDASGFYHHAFYNREASRVEMHLVSRRRQTIKIDGRIFKFDEGETIHTENSYKYSIEEFKQLVKQAGYLPVRTWTDANSLYSMHFLRPYDSRLGVRSYR